MPSHPHHLIRNLTMKLIHITLTTTFMAICALCTVQPAAASSGDNDLSKVMQKYHRQIMPDAMGYVNFIETQEGIKACQDYGRAVAAKFTS